MVNGLLLRKFPWETAFLNRRRRRSARSVFGFGTSPHGLSANVSQPRFGGLRLVAPHFLEDGFCDWSGSGGWRREHAPRTAGFCRPTGGARGARLNL